MSAPGLGDRTLADQAFACPICASGWLVPFLSAAELPVHVGVLWPTANDARGCPKGDIVLACCGGCGFVSNVALDSTLLDYAQAYDNSLHASAVFRAFEEVLVDRLIDRYGLRDRDVVEIGSGDGRFLRLLCEGGGNRGVGFDPSYDPEFVDPLARERVAFVPEPYSEAHAGRAADLVVCRHVLEHIANPLDLLTAVRRALDGREATVVYFEVPNALLTFRSLSVWDLVYEHCSYFSAGSLRYLFESCGFEVLSLAETYGGQFLSVEARPSPAGRRPWTDRPMDLSMVRRCTADFARHFQDRQRVWRTTLDRYAEAGTPVVVWGGGARAVTFFNMLGIGPDEIACVVDINERKQGTHLAGTGHAIVAPDVLAEYRPEVVIALNPLYTAEIEASLRGLGVPAAVVTA